MKKELQSFIKEVLTDQYYKASTEIFNFNEIQKLIKRHSEEYYNPDLLWSMVCLQIFLRNYKL